MTRRFRWWRAVFAFVIVSVVALPLLYGLAVVVSPPRTSDGHPVMPIGQVAFAIVFSPIAGGAAGFILGRR